MNYTYILYSPSLDRYYTGYTSDLDLRVERHNEGWSRSTKSGIPWELVYYKSFQTKTEAIQWENHIKKQKSRAFIEKIIASADNEFGPEQ